MAIAYTPTAAASVANNPRPSTGGAIPFTPGQTPAAPPTPTTPPADPNALVTGKGYLGNFIGNVSKLPGQLADAGKSLFKAVTGSEQAAGADAAAAIGGKGAIDQATKLAQQKSDSDLAFIKAMNEKQRSGQTLTPTQHNLYAEILNHTAQGGATPMDTATQQFPALAKSNSQVAGDFAGVAADVLGAGSYSKAGLVGDKALTTGLTKGTPTVVTAAQKGLDVAKGALTSTPEQAVAKQVAQIVDTVAPKMTAKESAQALVARGGTKSGILGTIKPNVDPSVQRIAQTVKQFVPDFSPKKSLVENINATKQAVGTLADNLKQAVVASGQDRIYSFKELGASLRGVEKPTLIAADSTLNKAYDLVTNKALEIARSNGGKVSDLFQARKEFDQFVSKQFPNLYSSDTLTPMRSAIKNIRNAMTDFTAEHLPPEVGLRDALTHQSRLLDAVENMSEKAASGAQKEVGTNAVTRFASKHPTATKYAIGGASALGIDKVVKDVTGLGI